MKKNNQLHIMDFVDSWFSSLAALGLRDTIFALRTAIFLNNSVFRDVEALGRDFAALGTKILLEQGRIKCLSDQQLSE